MSLAKPGGRQARDYDKLLDKAFESGLSLDKSDVTPHLVYRNLAPKSKVLYKSLLQPWKAYKNKYPNATPQDMKTLKHFAKFIALSMRGRVKKDNPHGRPTVDSVRNQMRKFCSAWNRDNVDKGQRIPEEMSLSMAPYIEGELADQIGLLRGKQAKVPRKYFTLDNYKILQQFHWEEDWHDYVHEGSRVDNTNMVNVHCYTSARQSEVCQAKYRDLECIIGYYNGEPDIKLKFTREFCKAKNVDQPEHPFPERMNVQDGLYPPLVAQPIIHWLANIISSQALAQYHTLDQILEARPPENRSYRTLEWADHMLDQPVFPEWQSEGRKPKPRLPTAWGKQASAWAIRAGLTNGLGFHSIRRKALINCNDGGYSLGSILKFASQNNTNVLVNKYLGTVCSVDGVAMYQNLSPRKDLAEDFLSSTMRYNPDLKFRLPSDKMKEIKNSDTYLSITKKIDILTSRIAAAEPGEDVCDLVMQRKREYRKRTAFTDQELRDFQLSQKINYDAKKEDREQTDWHKVRFNRIAHMLPPERIRLAATMKVQASPRDQVWKQAIQDLISLRNMDCTVAYQQSLQPTHGFCPVESCKQAMESLPVEKRWSHIYNCYKKRHLDQHGFAKFCFMCSEWVRNPASWVAHCETHIEMNNLPFRYDPVTFRYAIACVGYCPVCIWRTELEADERLRQYSNRAAWIRHISRCITSYVSSQDGKITLECPDGRCSIAFSTQECLWHHLDEIHSIPTPVVDDMDKWNPEPTGKWKDTGMQSIQHYSPRKLSPSLTLTGGQSWSSEALSDSASQTSKTSSSVWDDCRPCTPETQLSEAVYEFDKVDMMDDVACLPDVNVPPEAAIAQWEPPIDPILLSANDTNSARQSNSTIPSDFGFAEDGCEEGVLAIPERLEQELARDDQYLVDRLLGRWRHRGKVWFYLRWKDGSYGFVPEMDINSQDRKDFEANGFTGFHEGAFVKRVRVRNGKASYVTGFLGCADEWTLPEHALHPDLVADHKPTISGKVRGRRGRKRAR